MSKGYVFFLLFQMAEFGILTREQIDRFDQKCAEIPAPVWNVKILRRFGPPHNQQDAPTRYKVIFYGDDYDDRYLELNMREWAALKNMKNFVRRFFVTLYIGESDVANLFRGRQIKDLQPGWFQCTLPLHTQVDIVFMWNSDRRLAYIGIERLTSDEYMSARVEDYIYFFNRWVPQADYCIELAEEKLEEKPFGKIVIGGTDLPEE